MRVPDEPRPHWWQYYQIAVLGLSAAVVIAVSLLVYHAFHSVVDQPGSIALGLTAAGQVVGDGCYCSLHGKLKGLRQYGYVRGCVIIGGFNCPATTGADLLRPPL